MYKKFAELFEGATEAHGFYNVEPGPTGQKLLGERGTVRDPLTPDLWEMHLQGERGLGIIPINNENKVRWCAIDIDKYDIDLVALVKQIKRHKLPLIVCRTKSGGAHVYAFFDKFYPAKDVRAHLQTLAAGLGYGDCEQFPKQSNVLYDRGDLGSWLNMPYFEAKQSMRYGVKEDGEAMSLEEFLFEAGTCQLTLTEFQELKAIEAAEGMLDGPPCLQNLIATGVPEGTRNKVLFQYGVYTKKKYPEDWERQLETFNRDLVDPPMPSAEMLQIIKSLSRKDYQYQCTELPCINYCNKGLCKTRQYGIGFSDAAPTFGALSKLLTSPPVWFLDVDGVRMELTTEQIQNQTRFQHACIEQINKMPPKQKEQNWVQLINHLLDTAIPIEVPADASPEGQFYELLHSFTSDDRSVAKSKDELLIGKPWRDEETDRIYFRMQDLQNYLERNKFKEYKRPIIASKIRTLCSGKDATDFFNIKGSGVNVWSIPYKRGQTESFDTPKMPKDII